MDTLRLRNGTLFPIPINLDVTEQDVQRLGIKSGARLTLRDPRDDNALAIISVEDVYTPDKVHEAKMVFGVGVDDPAHPSITYLKNTVKDMYIGGKVQAIRRPIHFDYVDLRCESSVLSLDVAVLRMPASRHTCGAEGSFREAGVAESRRVSSMQDVLSGLP